MGEKGAEIAEGAGDIAEKGPLPVRRQVFALPPGRRRFGCCVPHPFHE
jgi:hypothetical protein